MNLVVAVVVAGVLFHHQSAGCLATAISRTSSMSNCVMSMAVDMMMLIIVVAIAAEGCVMSIVAASRNSR